MIEQDRPQHRYHAFLRYEQLLAKAVAAYPATIYCTPKGLALETVVARFRDATNAFLRNPHWESEAVDRAKLAANWENMEVAIDGKRVRIGQRRKREKGVPNPLQADVETIKTKELVVHSPTEEVLTAILLLHSQGILLDPTRVQALTFPIASLDMPPNVELTEQGGDIIIL